MYQVTQVTVDPNQAQTLVLYDGSTLDISMIFKPMQYGWFISMVHSSGWTINNLRIVNSPNFLQQWRNIIPFGMACYSKANLEPTLQEDFFSLASVLYILDASEVQAFTDLLNA